jgi:hypothetical protein
LAQLHQIPLTPVDLPRMKNRRLVTLILPSIFSFFIFALRNIIALCTLVLRNIALLRPFFASASCCSSWRFQFRRSTAKLFC